jgi:large subunit ribosomal protein L10
VDGETFYPPSVLNVDLDARRADLSKGARSALGLAIEIGYTTPETIPLLVTKAHRRALGLALAAGYITKETIEPLFAKAMREAAAVGKLTGN